MDYLKKADKSAESNVLEAQKVVHDMLTNIEKYGEKSVRDMLKNWMDGLERFYFLNQKLMKLHLEFRKASEMILILHVNKFMNLQKLSATL